MDPNKLLEFLASIYDVNKEDIHITYYDFDKLEEVEVTKPSNKGRKPKPHQITDRFVEVGGVGTC